MGKRSLVPEIDHEEVDIPEESRSLHDSNVNHHVLICRCRSWQIFLRATSVWMSAVWMNLRRTATWFRREYPGGAWPAICVLIVGAVVIGIKETVAP
jgi:hypothetical protein